LTNYAKIKNKEKINKLDNDYKSLIFDYESYSPDDCSLDLITLRFIDKYIYLNDKFKRFIRRKILGDEFVNFEKFGEIYYEKLKRLNDYFTYEIRL